MSGRDKHRVPRIPSCTCMVDLCGRSQQPRGRSSAASDAHTRKKKPTAGRRETCSLHVLASLGLPSLSSQAPPLQVFQVKSVRHPPACGAHTGGANDVTLQKHRRQTRKVFVSDGSRSAVSSRFHVSGEIRCVTFREEVTTRSPPGWPTG